MHTKQYIQVGHKGHSIHMDTFLKHAVGLKNMSKCLCSVDSIHINLKLYKTTVYEYKQKVKEKSYFIFIHIVHRYKCEIKFKIIFGNNIQWI